MNHIEAIIESLKSVLCDPKGNCCLRGSDADRAVVDVALAALASISQQGEPVGVLQDNALGLGKVFWFKKPADGSNLFVEPQPTEPPLTDEQITDIVTDWFDDGGPETRRGVQLARAIEAAHGITGGTT